MNQSLWRYLHGGHGTLLILIATCSSPLSFPYAVYGYGLQCCICYLSSCDCFIIVYAKC
uniref:Uncharacterized protein n=1 Tax=Sus scrofa TaxID=9823 RepID=A0A4X1UDP4_PIG